MQQISIKKFRCDACNKIYTLDVSTDERALFEQIECENCGSIAKRWFDPEAVIGNIEDVESMGMDL